MVYIHGGGFASGSGIIALAAEAFPREEGVVLVSVNHRLNVFGCTYAGENRDPEESGGRTADDSDIQAV